MEKRNGGCHCGAVRYSAAIDLDKPVVECNCSQCQMKGMLLSFAPAADFTLEKGEDQLSEYRFNKKQIAHLFCKTCGVQAFGRGEGPNGATVAINVRTLDDMDLATLTRQAFNGKEY